MDIPTLLWTAFFLVVFLVAGLVFNFVRKRRRRAGDYYYGPVGGFDEVEEAPKYDKGTESLDMMLEKEEEPPLTELTETNDAVCPKRLASNAGFRMPNPQPPGSPFPKKKKDEKVEPPVIDEQENVGAEKAPSPSLCFSSYFPAIMKPTTWHDMLVYVHSCDASKEVKLDSEKLLDKKELYGAEKAASKKKIPVGTEITIIPYLPDCTVNPQEAKVSWYEDWHRVNFRVRSNENVEKAVNGWIEFYAGPLLIAEMDISILISSKAVELGQKLAESKGSPYETVFVSYAHEDEQIVELIEKVVNSLGFEYLRDVSFLKSGEEWNPELLKNIDTADVFQLCWSKNAKESEYVEQEWRHALHKQKKRFIRPCYWQKPMVDPPDDLSKLHFSYLDLSGYLNKS